MFRTLFSASEPDMAATDQDFALGFEAIAAEEVFRGDALAIDTATFNKVLRAQTTVATRRAYCGVAANAALAGEVVRVMIIGKAILINTSPGIVIGDIVYTTATLGRVGPAVANSRAVGTALTNELLNLATFWIGVGHAVT